MLLAAHGILIDTNNHNELNLAFGLKTTLDLDFDFVTPGGSGGGQEGVPEFPMRTI